MTNQIRSQRRRQFLALLPADFDPALGQQHLTEDEITDLAEEADRLAEEDLEWKMETEALARKVRRRDWP